MKYGPNISIVAGLMGDPARSNIVMALMSGLSLPATELAREAGVTPSTATTHLNKLEACRLLRSMKRPLCRTCIDWSERQHHLGGALGAAVLARAVEEGWAKREPRVRVVTFSAQGQKRFVTWYS